LVVMDVWETEKWGLGRGEKTENHAPILPVRHGLRVLCGVAVGANL
jgi:hypothetical protein